MTPDVTFIIPHKGRENLLQATLASIAAQTGEITREVVLVTQNTELDPATHALLQQLHATVLQGNPGDTISALRNRGAHAAGGRLLAFLDADVALAPGWLQSLVPLLEARPDVKLVSAAQANGPNPPPLERLRTALSNAQLDTTVDFLPGRNLLLARSTFDAVGGFPEHLVTCEDYYFTDKVNELGALLYTSSTQYVHLGEDKVYREMFAKEVWRGQSNLQSIAGRRIGLGEWPSFIVPLWVTGCALGALVLGLTGNALGAMTLLALALLPFLGYVTRLYFLAAPRVPLVYILAFYAYYFPARTIGTLQGLWTTMRARRKQHAH